MDTSLTHLLFTGIGTLGLVAWCGATLYALPWTEADRAGTERGLDHLGAGLKQAWAAAVQELDAGVAVLRLAVVHAR